MENITFNLAQLHRYGTAFYEFLGLRKRFFVDQLGWSIPHDDDVEMDQYDNPMAYYSLVLRDGVVVGGTRAMATTAQWGSHTYMLRDAVAGKLIGIPPHILPRAEATTNVWEITRTVISDEVTTHAERSECLALMLDGAVDVAQEQGATELMSLSPVAMVRTLRKLGYETQRIGEPYRNAEDGRLYACMNMPAKRRKAAPALAAAAPKPTHAMDQRAVHSPSAI
ncbi:acyl-homoserine-lactone synthase [Cognatiyoonia sp. IB215446]|uniref:acyl-homoserine-lactone synthase n=1 Tax=Cognatiyoonia sp. IB215446 TaxID=3097355 RepID=UPI002A102DDB|nr:acyl-homoserine-lactone synthase [Cognatiyoonia sp. IB215446]MDX8349624.1 acyl-homoserine-lactone synthase [Cognatiyoonia sp. IB215446]